MLTIARISRVNHSHAPAFGARVFSSAARSPTAIVMLNMGGPATVAETGPFLHRLFTDREIIQLGPLQNILGPYLARRRTPRIEEQYKAIGGSPIRKWTELQGQEMAKRLDALCPESAPHVPYVCFRYAEPLTENVLARLRADGVTRAVAFSQYPQYSCTTTGSSLNHLWRESRKAGMDQSIKWSVIDRWHSHPDFIDAVVARIQMGMTQLFSKSVSQHSAAYHAESPPQIHPEHPLKSPQPPSQPASSALLNDEQRQERLAPPAHPSSLLEKCVIVFSAHSLPMRVVNRGDPYPQEVAATVQAVMHRLHGLTAAKGYTNKYMLAWQSQVGPLPWLGPQTGEVLEGLGKQGIKHVLVVPIAFTSDHVETLFEVDMEYSHVAHKAGITHFHRSPSLNDEPLIFDALARIAAKHLQSQEPCSSQYGFNCPQCTNPTCRTILNPVAPFRSLRDQAKLSNH